MTNFFAEHNARSVVNTPVRQAMLASHVATGKLEDSNFVKNVVAD